MAPDLRHAFAFPQRNVPGWWGVTLIVAAAFVVGLIAGWMTYAIPAGIAWVLPDDAEGTPGASTSGSPGGGEHPVVLYPPIERAFDVDDRDAGLTSVDVSTSGPGTFSVVPGVVEPAGDGPVRWVRVSYEDGLPVEPEAFADYVMTVLNSDSGWGARGRTSFGRTDGVADIRIVLASPITAGQLCPRPHQAAVTEIEQMDVPDSLTDFFALQQEREGAAQASASPSSTASPSPTLEPACADRGVAVLDAYLWAAGLPAFVDDRVAARHYLVNHPIGHILGQPDAQCTSGVADVMVDHSQPIDPCSPNPWPYPPES